MGETQTVEPLAVHFQAIAADAWAYDKTRKYIGQVDGWTFTSDGKLLVGVERAVAGIEGEPYSSVSALARKLLVVPVMGDSVALAGLRTWAGDLPGRPKCEGCKGTGFEDVCDDCDGYGTKECCCLECNDEHEADCRRCDGEGSVKCSEDGCPGPPGAKDKSLSYGRISVVALDRDLLARGLVDMPGESATVVTDPFTHLNGSDPLSHHLVLIGDGWRLLLMGVKHDESVSGVLSAYADPA